MNIIVGEEGGTKTPADGRLKSFPGISYVVQRVASKINLAAIVAWIAN